MWTLRPISTYSAVGTIHTDEPLTYLRQRERILKNLQPGIQKLLAFLVQMCIK